MASTSILHNSLLWALYTGQLIRVILTKENQVQAPIDKQINNGQPIDNVCAFSWSLSIDLSIEVRADVSGLYPLVNIYA